MKIDKYIEFVKESRNENYDKNKIMSYIALVEEVGEIGGVFKKEHSYKNYFKDDEFRDKLVDEVGDVLYQFINLLITYDIDLEELCDLNYKKLVKRHNGVKTDDKGGVR